MVEREEYSLMPSNSYPIAWSNFQFNQDELIERIGVELPNKEEDPKDEVTRIEANKGKAIEVTIVASTEAKRKKDDIERDECSEVEGHPIEKEGLRQEDVIPSRNISKVSLYPK